MYVSGGCVIAAVNIWKYSLSMEEILIDKGIIQKMTREGKNLTFYTAVNKAETLNKPQPENT